MDNRYNISQLFKLAFGTNLPVYLTVPIGKEPAHTAEYGSIRTVEREEAMRLSKLGTPIVFPVKFTAGSYKFYDYQSKIVEKQLADFWLPPATMVDFSRVKNIRCNRWQWHCKGNLWLWWLADTYSYRMPQRWAKRTRVRKTPYRMVGGDTIYLGRRRPFWVEKHSQPRDWKHWYT